VSIKSSFLRYHIVKTDMPHVKLPENNKPKKKVFNPHTWRHAVAQLVEAMHYKPGGRSLIPDNVIGFFQLHNTSGRTKALGLTQPLTEMSTRNTSYEVKAVGA